MYSKKQLALKYIQHYFNASNSKGHGIHSPFIYDFITNVYNDNENYSSYKIVEQLRKNLLLNKNKIEVEDYGAGSVISKTNIRTIQSICKNAAKPKKLAQLIYRIAHYYNCINSIELGTSLGITTSYIALANEFGRVITCEGSNNIATIAKENFKKLFIKNCTVIDGEFDKSFTQALEEIPSIDLLFIDGNHLYEPTLKYFETALPHLHQNSIVIFDDIHWSKEMENAWQKIKEHQDISETIDLFFIGIVFFRKEQKEKQHFKL